MSEAKEINGTFMLVVDKRHPDGREEFSIKQQITRPDGSRRYPRHPKKLYAHVPRNRQSLQAYVDKLNYGLDLKKLKELEVKSAFIPPSIMESFFAELRNQVTNTKDLQYVYSKVLQEYFLDFFIGRLKLLDPNDWIKKQSLWGNALVGEPQNRAHAIFDEKKSAKTIKTTIQTANRFMKHLHLQMPNDYPLYEFAPLSKNKLKTYEAERKRQEDEPTGRFITAEDWARINEKLPSDIKPFVRLMYHYGLRRAESLGFDTTDAVKRSHIEVKQQLRLFSVTGPKYEALKDREARKTPHWFVKPSEAHGWIMDGLQKKMHPDTLSVRWDELMKELGFEYRLHDLRRTFITNALRHHPSRDVQLAVGHSNIETTMRYAQDDRAMDDEIWKPAG